MVQFYIDFPYLKTIIKLDFKLVGVEYGIYKNGYFRGAKMQSKEIVDESDKRGQFILSGSQKLELMKGVSESLAGRVSLCELSGLSLRKIYKVDFNKF